MATGRDRLAQIVYFLHAKNTICVCLEMEISKMYRVVHRGVHKRENYKYFLVGFFLNAKNRE